MHRHTENTPQKISESSVRILVSNVSLEQDGRNILANVSLDLSAHRIGIVGRNGSGKTSLARVMCGLIPPTTGTVQIAGTDVAKDRKGALMAVGLIFQNPDHQIIFPTVIEEMSFGLRQQGQLPDDAKRNAIAVLQRFDRTEWADRSVSTLSQGQRQLVCLLSILAMKPKVIVLDEPFSGLDIPTTIRLQRYLSDLEPTLVHISHDPAALEGYDQVIWVEQGAVRSVGSASTVLPLYQQAMIQFGETDAFTDFSD